jgi:uncharacterized repeat protein (TIGR03803 family)
VKRDYNYNRGRFVAIRAVRLAAANRHQKAWITFSPEGAAAMSYSSVRSNLQPSRRVAISALAIVFALIAVSSPAAQAQTFTVLHAFTDGQDGAYPYAGPTMDKAGNLYGTTMGGVGLGTVYKMSNKGSGWVLTPLYVFQGGNDGAGPTTRAVIGSDGTLYGAARGGPGGNNQWRGFSA